MKTFYTYSIIDYDLIRDDLRSVDGIVPSTLYTSWERVVESLVKEINERGEEAGTENDDGEIAPFEDIKGRDLKFDVEQFGSREIVMTSSHPKWEFCMYNHTVTIHLMEVEE